MTPSYADVLDISHVASIQLVSLALEQACAVYYLTTHAIHSSLGLHEERTPI